MADSKTTRITKIGMKTVFAIYNYSRDFKGKKTDKELIKMLGICQATYYKYKKQVAEQYYRRSRKQKDESQADEPQAVDYLDITPIFDISDNIKEETKDDNE